MMTGNDKVNILMVDDQPAKLLTYEAVLSELGENLVQAASAREALEQLLRHDVAVVLMDVSMPELDGFELADLIRQHPRFQKTAIIFISGVHLSESDTINGYRRGAVDYIQVPVVPEVLRAKVSVFVDLHRKTRMLERLNNELEQRVGIRTEELRQSEEQFRTLANSIPQLAWMAEADGSPFWYNQRWCDFAGVSMQNLVESSWAYLRHPDHEHRVLAGIQRAIETSDSWEDTFPLRCRDGEYRWFLCRAVPIHGSQGDVVRWFGTATDVTDQIAAEDRIRTLNRQLEQRVDELETIMQALPVGIAILNDASPNEITTNVAFQQLFNGYPESRLGDVSKAANGSDRIAEPLSVMMESIEAGDSINEREMRFADSDGSDRHVLASAKPLLEDSGRARGSVGVFFDVSHRKRLEDTLRERAELLELASEAIMVQDVKGAIRYWNLGAESLYGWTPEEAMGKDVHELLRSVFPNSHAEVDHALRTQGFWRGNLIQWTKDGREVIAASRMALNHETGVLLEINRDITGELRAEEALRQSEKLAAMGRMAGIIAHEINNPLAAITNSFYLLRHHPSLDSEAQYFASLAEQELARASHITRQTLSFYRESNEPIAVSISEVIESVLELQQVNIQSFGIVVDKRFRSNQPIYGYPVELRQVFLNLIDNAVQAMPKGGTLRIHVWESTGLTDGRRGISVAVTDTGIGISQADAKKLFQPFFSTKSTKGTGLGLWISQGILQKYAGKISFRSQKYCGRNYTCFRVFLPSDAFVTMPRRQTDKTDALSIS